MNGKIYILKDPITEQIRYVGQTRKELIDRLYRHWRDRRQNKNKNNYTANWICKLWDLHKVKPIIILIESNIQNQILLNIREKYWISFFKEKGNKLTNTSDKDYFITTGIRRNYFKKRVYCYTRDYIESEYESARKASEVLKVSYKEISSICKGKKTNGEFCFSFSKLEKSQIDESFNTKTSVKIKIISTDVKTGETRIWESQQEASRYFKINFRNINQCLRGLRKTCGGQTWNYEHKYQKVLSKR